MLKNILNLNGVSRIKKTHQKKILAGKTECEQDQDCLQEAWEFGEHTYNTFCGLDGFSENYAQEAAYNATNYYATKYCGC